MNAIPHILDIQMISISYDNHWIYILLDVLTYKL